MQYLFTAASLPRSTFLVNRLVCRVATLSLLTAVSECFNRCEATLTATFGFFHCASRPFLLLQLDIRHGE